MLGEHAGELAGEVRRTAPATTPPGSGSSWSRRWPRPCTRRAPPASPGSAATLASCLVGGEEDRCRRRNREGSCRNREDPCRRGASECLSNRAGGACIACVEEIVRGQRHRRVSGGTEGGVGGQRSDGGR